MIYIMVNLTFQIYFKMVNLNMYLMTGRIITHLPPKPVVLPSRKNKTKSNIH